MKISILQASKAWGVSRNTIYEKHKRGELSMEKGEGIDPSEMVRVFGKPKDKRTKITVLDESTVRAMQDSIEDNQSTEKETRIKELETALQNEKERRAEVEKRAERAENQADKLLEQIGKLADTIKLLEAPKGDTVQIRPPEPTYTTPHQPVRDYSQWEEDRPRKKKGLLSRLF